MELKRYDYEPFAVEAEDTGQFGSAVVGTKVLTKDVTDMQSLPAWKQGWSSAINPAVGKGAPAREDMQAVNAVSSYGVSYLHQRGIAEWSPNTEYYAGCVCEYNGILWRCTAPEGQPSIGVEPYFGTEKIRIRNVYSRPIYWVAFAENIGRNFCTTSGGGNNGRRGLWYSDDHWTTITQVSLDYDYGDASISCVGYYDATDNTVWVAGTHESSSGTKRNMTVFGLKADTLQQVFRYGSLQRVAARAMVRHAVDRSGTTDHILMVVGENYLSEPARKIIWYWQSNPAGTMHELAIAGAFPNSIAINPVSGAVVMGNNETAGSVLLASISDSGLSNPVVKPTTVSTSTVTQVKFDGDANKFRAVTTDGKLLESSDDGQTWILTAQVGNVALYSFYKNSRNNVWWFCGTGTKSFYSDDNLATFTPINFGYGNSPIYSVTGDDEYEMIGGTQDGQILEYNDDSLTNDWDGLIVSEGIAFQTDPLFKIGGILVVNKGEIVGGSGNQTITFAEAYTVQPFGAMATTSAGAVTVTNLSNTSMTINGIPNGSTVYWSVWGY